MSNTAVVSSEIKECPVCHAWCFSDMDICYGCLHDFSKDKSSENIALQDLQVSAVQQSVNNSRQEDNQRADVRQASCSSGVRLHRPPKELESKRDQNEDPINTPLKELSPQLLELMPNQQLEVIVSLRVVEATK